MAHSKHVLVIIHTTKLSMLKHICNFITEEAETRRIMNLRSAWLYSEFQAVWIQAKALTLGGKKYIFFFNILIYSQDIFTYTYMLYVHYPNTVCIIYKTKYVINKYLGHGLKTKHSRQTNQEVLI